MGEYSHQGQSRELSDAISKAKGGHSGRTKYALVGATLLAAGGLLAGGLALADSGDVPPHEERVAYLMKNLPEGKPHSLKYSPYFQVGKMVSKDGWLASTAIQYGHTGSAAAGVLDASADDGDASIDFAYLILADRSGERLCVIPDEELGELEEKMDEHYVVSTDAWYRALTEGNESIEGALGRDEYVQMFTLCKGRWQAAGDDALESVMESAEDVPPHEERVAYLLREHPDTQFQMDYAPDFVLARGWITGREHVWVSLYSMSSSPQLSKVLGIIDGASRDNSADGTLDWVWGKLPLGDGTGIFCMTEYGNLPAEMREDLAGHYVISSEAYYLHFKEGLGEYESTAGEEQFREFMEIAKGLDACGIIHPPR